MGKYHKCADCGNWTSVEHTNSSGWYCGYNSTHRSHSATKDE